MNRETFLAASRAASQSLDFLTVAVSLAAEGKADDAERVLKVVGSFWLLHGPAISSVKEALAGVAASPIKCFGPQGRVWFSSSAHDAVYTLWTRLDLCTGHPAWTMPADLADWLGIDASLLAAGLLQERAKLSPTLPEPEGEWVIRAEAARRLDISSTEVGNRVDAGELVDNGKAGRARLVFVPHSMRKDVKQT